MTAIANRKRQIQANDTQVEDYFLLRINTYSISVPVSILRLFLCDWLKISHRAHSLKKIRIKSRISPALSFVCVQPPHCQTLVLLHKKMKGGCKSRLLNEAWGPAKHEPVLKHGCSLNQHIIFGSKKWEVRTPLPSPTPYLHHNS